MSQDRFYNYYVEILNSTLQDAIGKNLVFQAQARITKEDLESLNHSLESFGEKMDAYAQLEQTLDQQVNSLNSKNLQIENLTRERDHARQEASHIETFRNELISARQELQQRNVELQTIKATHEKEVSEVKIEYEKKLVSLKSDCDRILMELELNKQKEIKQLKEKIEYYEMSPAQKRKFNLSNKNNINQKVLRMSEEELKKFESEEFSNKTESAIIKDDSKVSKTENSTKKEILIKFDDAESDENKDGGTF